MTRKPSRKKSDETLKHGCYQNLSRETIDGRTKIARMLSQIEAELLSAIPDPSPQELLLIQAATIKAVRCRLAGPLILTDEASDRLKNDYLRWSCEMRNDLVRLGLKRRAKPVQSLAQYLSEKYGDNDEKE